MNISSVLNILGSLLLLVALAMVLPVLVGVYYQEDDCFAFIITAGITYLSGSLLRRFKYRQGIQYKEGFAVVTLGWLLVSLYGALPFLLTGIFSDPVDAFFESVSGFTTTGATVIVSLESLSRTILFWRSLTHWLGGMGIIVMTIAILPELAGNMHLYVAETSGPLQQRLKPRIQETAKTLWLIYTSLTLAEVVLLKINGVPLFEAVIHSFGTISTGGFSSRALSVQAYDSIAVEGIVTLFMFLSGINFTLIFHSLHGRLKLLFYDEEFRLYSGLTLAAVLLIALNLHYNLYNDLNQSLRYAAFQVMSIASTTGFATCNYDTWPPFSRWILLVLMFVGGCAGSTAGGIKVIRIRVLLKKGMQELYHLLHPRAIRKIKINRRVVSETVSTSILGFFFLYITVFVTVTICLTYFGTDLISSISAVAATLGNIGPGLGLVGPLKTFLPLQREAKLLLSSCMLMGRLEIYTILVFISMDWR